MMIASPFYYLQFTKKSVVDAYSGFVRNVKRADEAIRLDQ